jgi:hypothetical protein
MTTGSILYLIMSLAMFAAFSIVLAYESWQQSRLGPDIISEPVAQPESHPAIAA